jgi:hypothetical protein
MISIPYFLCSLFLELLKTTPFKKKPEPDLHIELHGHPQQLTDLCTFTPRGARGSVSPNNPSSSDDGTSMGSGGGGQLGVPQVAALASHPNSPRKKSVSAQLSEIIHNPSIFITNTTYSPTTAGGGNPTMTNSNPANSSPQSSTAMMTNGNYTHLVSPNPNAAAFNTNPNAGTNTPPSERDREVHSSTPTQPVSNRLGEKKDKEKSFKTKLNFPGRKLSGTRPVREAIFSFFILEVCLFFRRKTIKTKK